MSPHLERLRRLTDLLTKQVISHEFVSLELHEHDGRWVAVVEGGGEGELVSSPHSRAVVLRWQLPGGQTFPMHRHPYEEILVVARGRVLIRGRVLCPGDAITVVAGVDHDCAALDGEAEFFVIWSENRLIFNHEKES